MTEARIVTVSGGEAGVRDIPGLAWKTTLKPVDIQTAFGDGADVSPNEARRALREGAALRAPSFYQMQLQRLWSTPFASLVMLLLSAPVALVNFRGGRAPLVMGLSLGAGMLFMIVDGLLAATGEGGGMPILIAAWTAPLLFAALASTVLLREEG